MQQDFSSTLAVLSATPATLNSLLRTLPDTWTQPNEGDGTWSVAQVLAHLIHAERSDWLPRVLIILRSGESETFPVFRLDAHLSKAHHSITDLLKQFSELRTESLIELRALNLDARDLVRRGCHPAFGTVTLSQLLATWVTHDLTHLHQISRILAHQYRDAVGPWSQYLGVLHCNGHSSTA